VYSRSASGLRGLLRMRLALVSAIRGSTPTPGRARQVLHIRRVGVDRIVDLDGSLSGRRWPREDFE